MIFEYLTKKFLDELYNRIKKIILDNDYSLLRSRKDLENSIDHHLNSVRNWSEQISFKDLNKHKSVKEIYIDVDLYLTPLKLHVDRKERENILSLKEVLELHHGHTIILGQPGAGKTTSMKRLCQICFYETEISNYSFPIYFALRDLPEDTDSLLEYILAVFGIVIDGNGKKNGKEIHEKIACTLLDSFNAVIIFDGFDELPSALRPKVSGDIKKLILGLNTTRVFLTSRSNEIDFDIENTQIFEIKELSKKQIDLFAYKWIGDVDEADVFLKQLATSPFSDMAIRPLTIAHLCAIFQRVGKIPDKPKTVYRKIVNLLLEEWDEQKKVKRQSKYAYFEIDRKREFLANLAFELTVGLNKVRFNAEEIREIYLKVLFENFDLPKNDVRFVIKELENHTGLIFQSSYTEFEFAHKSLQEYLCAEHIVGLPVIGFDFEKLLIIPNELAIVVSISSNPTQYLASLVLNNLFENRWFDTKYIDKALGNISLEDKVHVGKAFGSFLSPFLNRILAEKIDFNSSPLLGITFIYIDTIQKSFSDHSIIGNPVISKLIIKALKMPIVSKSLNNLSDYYDIVENARSGKWQLISKGVNKIDGISIPRYLDGKYYMSS